MPKAAKKKDSVDDASAPAATAKRTAKQSDQPNLDQSDQPKAKQKKSKSGEASMENSVEEVKIVIIKGKAAVDSECSEKVDSAHVYCEGADVYDAMLNQADVMNNNNKYYVLQLLRDDDRAVYSVWFRWGRVGKAGQHSLTVCGNDLDQAKSLFAKKFNEKTKNKWDERENFVKVKGKYDLLKMDYDTEEVQKEEAVRPEKKKKEQTASCLHQKLQSLLDLIFNIEKMEATVVEMQYDAKKAPLGKLTTQQIKAGYTALKKIEDLIKKEDFGPALTEACNEFYTRIPHDFGMRRPPIISTLEVVHAKCDMLEALGDIEIAMKLLREELETDEHPLDRHYKSLSCGLKVIDDASSNYEMIEQYLQNTHGSTHCNYKLNLVNLFEVDRSTEKNDFKDVGNRMLLWHGSRLTNFAGILKQGLRIAPPEAPVTGYMFDKGIYFADMSSKSANYCYPSRSSRKGLLLLCEVSLGTQNKLLDSNYNASKMPKGHHSVMGLGQVAPNSQENIVLSDGTVVPMGKSADTKVTNPKGYVLQYNEYIVYDPKQVRIRYLLDVDFKFK